VPPPPRPLTHGVHECRTIDGPDALPPLLSAWARSGFAGGERVVYVDPDGADGLFLAGLTAMGVPIADPLSSGQLVVLTPDEAFRCADGRFDAGAKMAEQAAFAEACLAEGFTAVRMAAEVSVALTAMPDAAALLDFEHGVEALSTALPVSALCLYDRAVLGSDLTRYVEAHPRRAADTQVVIRSQPGWLEVVGEVDLSNGDLLRGVARRAVPLDGELVVDVRRLTFADLGAALEVVAIARRLEDVTVRVLGAPRGLQRILSVAGWPLPTRLEVVGL
jgi:hypothetical protein